MSFFSKNYDRLMNPFEHKLFRPICSKLIKKAEGKVVEIGSGTGLNFCLYENVDVTAIEPDDLRRTQSLDRIETSKVPIRVLKGNGERLQFSQNFFDVHPGSVKGFVKE